MQYNYRRGYEQGVKDERERIIAYLMEEPLDPLFPEQIAEKIMEGVK